nr:hypothetical protein CFP56_21922 [Quercus suber]
MSSSHPFHVRKAANALRRSIISVQASKRNLSITHGNAYVDAVSIDDEPPTATESLRYLQYQDQAKLQETHSALNAYLRQARALQDSVQRYSSIKLSSAPDQPAYHLSSMRAKARLVDDVKAQLFKHGMRLKEHLTDLQHEPYQADMDEQLHAWQREIAMKDDFEVLDMYQSSDLEDAAKVNRLRKQVDALYRRVSIAAGLQSEADDGQQVGSMADDPFALPEGREGARRDSAPTRAPRDWRAAERLPPSSRDAVAARSLADRRSGSGSSSTKWTPFPHPSPEVADAQTSPDRPLHEASRGASRRLRRPRSLSDRPLSGPEDADAMLRNEGAAAVGSPGASRDAQPPTAPLVSAATSAGGTALPARRRSLAEEQQRLEMDMQRGQQGRRKK